MSSKRATISQPEWEHHRQTIVEYYRNDRLKNVRDKMQSEHGFDASIAQYEAQVRRWGIRKNTKQHEWQIIFARGNPVARSSAEQIGVAPVVRERSHATIRRARRWALKDRTFNGTHSQESLPPGTTVGGPSAENFRQPSFLPNEEEELYMGVGSSRLSFSPMDMTVQEIFNSRSGMFWDNPMQLHASMGPFSSRLLTTASPLAAIDDHRPSVQLMASGVYRKEAFPLLSTLEDLENNELFFNFLSMTPEEKNSMPFYELETAIRSRIFSTGRINSVFGDSASTLATAILSRREQFAITNLQKPDFRRTLDRLGSLIPGENLVINTRNPFSDPNLLRSLLFSVLNGFASNNGFTGSEMLDFFNLTPNRHLLLDVLGHGPSYISRTLIDVIACAAIATGDDEAMRLLLEYRTIDGRQLLDANQVLRGHGIYEETLLNEAASCKSLHMAYLLVSYGADKLRMRADHLDFMDKFQEYANHREIPEIPDIPNTNVDTPAKVFQRAVKEHAPAETLCHLSLQISRDEHFSLFQTPSFLHNLLEASNESVSIQVLRNILNNCTGICDQCVKGNEQSLTVALGLGIKRGYFAFLRFLVEISDTEQLNTCFMMAIRSKNKEFIEFVLTRNPPLDPPASYLGWNSTLIRRPTPVTPLSEALRTDNEYLINYLESAGAASRPTWGQSLLLIEAAAEAGKVTYLKNFLPRATISKEALRPSSEALKIAIEKGNDKITKMLLEAGAEVPGWELLNDALKGQNPNLVQTLLSFGCKPEFSNNKIEWIDDSILFDILAHYPGVRLSVSGLTQLCRQCIKNNNLALFQVLAAPQCDGESEDFVSCIEVAIAEENNDMLDLLLEISSTHVKSRILRSLLSKGLTRTLQHLCEKYAPHDFPLKPFGAKELMETLNCCNEKALDIMFESQALDLSTLRRFLDQSREPSIATPLGMAIDGRQIKDLCSWNLRETVIMKLIANSSLDGIAMWSEEYGYETALMIAIREGRDDILELLINAGANINKGPELSIRRTPLQYASEKGDLSIVRRLLKHKIDVNAEPVCRAGATAIQFAAISGNCNIVAELLSYGANLGASPPRVDGRWPLEGAAEYGRLDMIKYLWDLQYKAEFMGIPYDGFSRRQGLRAMYLAQENGHIGCSDLISSLFKISVDCLKTEDYGPLWLSY